MNHKFNFDCSAFSLVDWTQNLIDVVKLLLNFDLQPETFVYQKLELCDAKRNSNPNWKCVGLVLNAKGSGMMMCTWR
jgi:hypothetical protein